MSEGVHLLYNKIMADENKTIGIWVCNNCSTVKGVSNGFCPKCGPTQTTPQDESAKALAGLNEEVETEEEDSESEAIKHK